MNEATLAYIRLIANGLGLTDWKINVEYDALPDDVYARCHVPRGRQEATLTFGEQFVGSSPEEQRVTIVHELLHCHFSAADHLLEESLPTLVGAPAYNSISTAYNLMAERGIEAVAIAIACMGVIPLPPAEE